MSARNPVRIVSELALANHGLVTNAAAYERSVDRLTLKRMTDRGFLELVRPGIRRLSGTPPTPRQELLAAVFDAGPQAAASHRSAAALWGLTDLWPYMPELSIPREVTRKVRRAQVHRSRDLYSRLVRVVDHIPTTSPALTLVNLADVEPTSVVEDVLERALLGQLVTGRQIGRLVDELARSGRRGPAAIRRLMKDRALGDDPPHSLLEAEMAKVFKRFKLPKPAYQHRLFHEGRFVARLDFAYPAHELAIEVDGLAAHRTGKALTYDLRRQNAIVRAGWTILRFTWTDVIERPEYVAAEILSHLQVGP